MFGSTILDVAIGLSLIYLSFSLFCSAIREGIARLLDQREAGFVRGVYRLLGADPPANLKDALTASSTIAASPRNQGGAATIASGTKLAESVIGHELVRGLSAKLGTLPANVPSHAFAMALLDTLAPTGEEPRSVDDVRRLVSEIPDPRVQQALMPLVNAAGKDFLALQRSIERRFDDTMARVSDWYKRNSQVWIAVIALLVAGLGNVDSIDIAQTLWRDPTIRAHVVATAATQSPKDASGDPYATTSEAMKAMKLPLGWDKERLKEAEANLPSKVIGLLVTALALLLGAPFWFDVLTQLASARDPKPVLALSPKPADSPGPSTVISAPRISAETIAVQQVAAVPGQAAQSSQPAQGITAVQVTPGTQTVPAADVKTDVETDVETDVNTG